MATIRTDPNYRKRLMRVGLSKDKPTSRSFYKVSDGTSTIDPNLTKAICEATCG